MLTKSLRTSLRSVVKPHCTPAQPCPKCSLLLVIRYRFNAFREQFGYEPKPTDPLFFDGSKSRPVKASLCGAREQIEAAAAAAGIKAAPVLRLLNLDSSKSEEQAVRIDRGPAQPGKSRAIVNPRPSKLGSAWERFARNERLHRLHNVTPKELRTLSGLAMMGEIRSSRDVLFVLNLLREQMAPR